MVASPTRRIGAGRKRVVDAGARPEAPSGLPDIVATMWAPVAQIAFLGAAGLVAGAVSSAGAIGSLISYPALLIIGIAPLPANVTHAVALGAIGVGSTARSQPELRGAGRRVVRWSAVAAVGALGGTALLLLVPGTWFDWAVPFLVLIAVGLLLAQPRIQTWRAGRPPREPAPPRHRTVLPYGLFTVGAYDGYFGAASGVMMTVLLLLTVEPKLVRANAMKNAVLGGCDLLAAISFAIFGPVHWVAVPPLAVGFLLGGALGPALARRVPVNVLRSVIAVAGVALAGWLLRTAVTG